jgi:ubiquinone/menaquinone biosynthesis C-methylase UbiE
MSASPSIDPAAFRALEHAGWEGGVAGYDAAFRTLTAQTIDPLLDAAGVGPGVRVLDEATGPGYVAAAAAHRGAHVTAGDFSAAMVAETRRRHPEIDVREADAEALPFGDGAFDAVVMNFGVLHLAQPDLAFAEAYRVLRPGGRFAFTAWAAPEVSIGLDMVLRAIQTHGTTDVPLPSGPPFFRFSDPAECQRALEAVGFTAVQSTTLPLVWRFPDAKAVFAAIQQGTVRTAALLRAQTPEALAAIREAVRTDAATYATDSGVEVPMGAVLTAARKSGSRDQGR